MKVLVQHLENLLPEHDCVVVPGLGGFVQSEVHARIQPGARLFYPGSKEIGFNHRLKFNDGLLAQSYQEAKGLSFEEANSEIQIAVQEIQEKLEAGKFIRLGRIGTLFMIDKQLIFRPDHHNHFYPEAYGLTPFTFPLLNKAVISAEVVTTPSFEPEVKVEAVVGKEKKKAKSETKSSRDEFIHIRFNRSRVRQIVAGVALFLFLILFSKPAGKPSGSQEASMMHNYLSSTSRSVPVAVKKDSAPTATLSVKDSAKPIAETRTAVPTPSMQKNATVPLSSLVHEVDPESYYIIVSAFNQKATARRWIMEHQGESFIKEAGIIKADGHARVFIKRFKDQEQAAQFLSEFTASSSEYASSWIYSAKND